MSRSGRAVEGSAEVVVTCDGGVATVVLDRPDKLNAVTVSLCEQLESVLLELAAREDVGVVVVRGAGGNFSAGGDFDELHALRRAGPRALARLFDAFGRALSVIPTMRQPVIAAVEGVATAGGFELMQACDMVLIRQDARVSDTHIRFGLIPGGGSTQRLPRLIGRQQALWHLLSGETLGAEDVLRLGLANRVIPSDTFDAEVRAFATVLAGRNRQAVAQIKALVTRSLEESLPLDLAAERAAVVELVSGPAGEAAFAAFAERR